ncbi:hypothetical protein Q8A73_015839 [Channa argus]|nr:hypothetical protein Q8A73_015839 [Channa argus]
MKSTFLLLGMCSLIICTVYNKLISNRSFVTSSDLNLKTTSAAQQEDKIEAPCSLRKAVRNDTFFRKSFSFSVPVLQWMGSFLESAWENLKNDAPPYGWKGLPIDVVNSTLSLLNSSHLFDHGLPDRCVRCAVVGNGGILRGSRQGKDIDSHDFVFRVNGAVIRGFEEDVGTNISFYGFTVNTMTHALRWYKKDGFTKVPQGPRLCDVGRCSSWSDCPIRQRQGGHTQYFGHNTSDSFKILHPEFISYVTKSFLNSPRMTNNLYIPSTGALMLLTALHSCDQVSAYGFITSNYAAFSDHYYDPKHKPLKFYTNHDMQMESRLWEALHLRNIMKLYQRSKDK